MSATHSTRDLSRKRNFFNAKFFFDDDAMLKILSVTYLINSETKHRILRHLFSTG